MVTNHKLVCARAARHEFKDAYTGGIRDYRSARLAAHALGQHLLLRLPDHLPVEPLAHAWGDELASFAWDGCITKENSDARTRNLSFRIMARKRPLQPREIEVSDYDSVSVEGANNSAIVHDGRVHRDGRTLYMVHSRFCLDRIFGEAASNAEVYADAAQPLLKAALAGGRSTLILFGQTGTGKTYTASGVLNHLVEELFESRSQSQVVAPVSVLVYEVAGSRGGREDCFDLLSERKQVKCLTGEDGQVHVRGARTIPCHTVAELHEALRAAFAWRSSECTERNDASSRSHAIVELQLPVLTASTLAGSGCTQSSDHPASTSEGPRVEVADASSDAAATYGVLRVVDLAGSERNFETRQHTRSMAERGGHINFSLLMLKECARLMHRNRQLHDDGKQEYHVPFRRSKLTHLLKSCFTDEAHMTSVIATLSPSPTDVEHSLNSLQHVCMMRAGRSWEQKGGSGSSAARPSKLTATGFSQVEGRGHGLHSKLQDNRRTQMNLHAFDMVTAVGGTIQKKYDAENLKTETFIDRRWHREMNVDVEENDLWVLREADAEVVQILTAWREQQWQTLKAHDLGRWNAATLHGFIASLALPGQVRIPSTMTGTQLRRLGRRGITALCSDEAAADALWTAVQGERVANDECVASRLSSNAKITALGANKVHAALPESEDQQPRTDTQQDDPC